jgi:hypothetical protein
VGDEERAAEWASKADRAFAHLIERIHDREIRDTIVSAALSEPSIERGSHG